MKRLFIALAVILLGLASLATAQTQSSYTATSLTLKPWGKSTAQTGNLITFTTGGIKKGMFLISLYDADVSVGDSVVRPTLQYKYVYSGKIWGDSTGGWMTIIPADSTVIPGAELHLSYQYDFTGMAFGGGSVMIQAIGNKLSDSTTMVVDGYTSYTN